MKSSAVIKPVQGRVGDGGPGPRSRYRSDLAPGRAFDFLYDPLYVLSSEKDHAQANVQAHLLCDRMKKMPIFKTMFSSLIHYPWYNLRLEEKFPVPPFIDRRWRGKAQQRLEALQQLARSQPSLQIPHIMNEDPEISGRNRYKYFERPCIPFHKPFPLNVAYAVARFLGRPALFQPPRQDTFPHQASLSETVVSFTNAPPAACRLKQLRRQKGT